MILLLTLMGCPKAPDLGGPLEVDPARLLAQAQAEPLPEASAVNFDLALDIGEQHLSAQGSLVVAPPNRFRIEVRGPIGPAQVIIVSDGVGIRAWLAAKNTVYTLDDADARIKAITEGPGLDALASTLLGRLPALGAPDESLVTDLAAWRWNGPEQSHLDARLDPRTAHLSALTLVDQQGASLFVAAIEGHARPEQLVADLPTKAVHATLEFGDWRDATPPDSAFTLMIPASATVEPLTLAPG